MFSLYVLAARLANGYGQSRRSPTPHPVIDRKYHSIEFLPFCSAQRKHDHLLSANTQFLHFRFMASASALHMTIVKWPR